MRSQGRTQAGSRSSEPGRLFVLVIKLSFRSVIGRRSVARRTVENSSTKKKKRALSRCTYESNQLFARNLYLEGVVDPGFLNVRSRSSIPSTK